jgi:hypothetical protein
VVAVIVVDGLLPLCLFPPWSACGSFDTNAAAGHLEDD